MSFLVNLYKIAGSSKNDREDFVSAALVELMNRDRSAREAVLSVFGLDDLVDCDVIAQQTPYAGDGEYLGEADIFIQPRGARNAVVIEAKVTDGFHRDQVEKYTRADGVHEVWFLSPDRKRVDDADWKARTRLWSKIHRNVALLELEGRVTPWASAFLDLLRHVEDEVSGHRMVGTPSLKHLPLARMRCAALLVKSANRAMKKAVRESAVDEGEGFEFWDDDLLDWAWQVGPEGEGSGFGLRVERGSAEGLLAWQAYVRCKTPGTGWEEYGGGWWVTELLVPAGRGDDFSRSLSKALKQARAVVSQSEVGALQLAEHVPPPAQVRCADVAEGLRLVHEGKRVLDAHAGSWRSRIRRRLEKHGRIGSWRRVEGRGDAPRLIRDCGNWYLYPEVDWQKLSPRWRIRIWRGHRTHIKDLARMLRTKDTGCWKVSFEQDEAPYRIVLSTKVGPIKPSKLFEQLERPLFEALEEVFEAEGQSPD